MIQIGDIIVSLDIIEEKFCCDLEICKGICCIEGDAGAPLLAGEKEKLAVEYQAFKPYMKKEGVAAVGKQGFAVVDVEGDMVTPLVNNCECAYSISENGCCWCAIEKAWSEGKTQFRKPESCFLYPIRVARFGKYEALNYHKWDVCACARKKGEQENIRVYQFLKAPLVAKYGEEWYAELALAAREYLQVYRKGNFSK